MSCRPGAIGAVSTADSCKLQVSMTSAPSTHTRMPSSLIVRSVYVPGCSCTVVVATTANLVSGTPAIVGRYHM
jgi:hypothetical protein